MDVDWRTLTHELPQVGEALPRLLGGLRDGRAVLQALQHNLVLIHVEVAVKQSAAHVAVDLKMDKI